MREYSVSMGRANIMAVAWATPLMAALGSAYVLRWGWWSLGMGLLGFLEPWVLALSILPGILFHEGLHAIGWAIAARRPLRSIRMGIRWRSLAPYAHPRQPIRAGAYRAGALLPALGLGVFPCVLAIAQGRPVLMIFGLVFTLAAGGDFLVLWLLRSVGHDELVQDHPTRAGCTVLPPSSAR